MITRGSSPILIFFCILYSFKMNYSISELTRLNKKRMNSKQPYILCYNLWLHREFCFFFSWLCWDSPPRPSEHFSDLIQLNVIRNSSLLWLCWDSPPRPSEHFSDLIQLNVIRNSSLFVTPLGFAPKTFRTFFWPHSAKCHQNVVTFCDSVGIQTQDLQNRNLTLYSAKLRSLMIVQRYSKVCIIPNEQ